MAGISLVPQAPVRTAPVSLGGAVMITGNPVFPTHLLRPQIVPHRRSTIELVRQFDFS